MEEKQISCCYMDVFHARIKLKGVEIEADVIVANILADILIHLTEDAYHLVKDEGYLIMSGIIRDKWDMVRESAEAAGFFLETHMIQGEWNACVFKKTKDISGVTGELAKPFTRYCCMLASNHTGDSLGLLEDTGIPLPLNHMGFKEKSS